MADETTQSKKPVLLLIGPDKVSRLNFAHCLLDYTIFPENTFCVSTQKIRLINADVDDFEHDPTREKWKQLYSIGYINAVALCLPKRFKRDINLEYTISYYKKLFGNVFDSKQVFSVFTNTHDEESLLKIAKFEIRKLSYRKVKHISQIINMDLSFGFIMKRVDDEEDSSNSMMIQLENSLSIMNQIDIRPNLLPKIYYRKF